MLLQGDGFDHYLVSLLSSKWDYVSGNVVGLSASYSRFTDDARLQGLRENSGFSIVGQQAIGKNLPAANTGWGFFGIGFRLPMMPTQGYFVPIAVYDIAASGNMKLCALVGADGSINIGFIICSNFSTNLTILASSPTGLVVANTFYTIEAGFKINSTLGGCIVSLNGATSGDGYLTYSGNTVRSTGSNHFADSTSERFTHVRLGGFVNNAADGSVADIDDFYYCDDVDSGDGLTNTFLHDWRLGLLLSVGSGLLTELTPIGDTPNWECIDDTAPDDLGTYVYGSDVGLEDSYKFEDIPVEPELIYGFLFNNRISKDDAEARTYQSRITPAASAPSTVATRSAPNGFINQQDPLEFNPATGDRYTAAEFNASYPGFRIAS